MKIIMLIPVSGYKSGTPVYSVFIKREMAFLESGGIEVFPVYIGSRYRLKEIYRTAREISLISKREGIQLIHVQTGTAAIVGLFEKQWPPIVITLGGSEILGYPGRGLIWSIRGYIAAWVTKMACKKADLIIAVSNNLKEAMPDKYQEKIEILPRAVDTSFFKPIPKSTARDILGWSMDKKYIVFSNPRPEAKVKNLPLAQRVVSIVQKEIDQRVELKILYKKQPKEVLWMLNAADALLVTSFHEGSPNIVKEAMACNLPIVSVPCGDVKEMTFNDNKSSVVSYNERDLADSLLKILYENGRSDGRKIIYEKGITKEGYVSKIVSIYRKVINSR